MPPAGVGPSSPCRRVEGVEGQGIVERSSRPTHRNPFPSLERLEVKGVDALPRHALVFGKYLYGEESTSDGRDPKPRSTVNTFSSGGTGPE